MVYLIERDSVQEEKVVISRASVDIHAGEQFSAGSDSRKRLKRLYHVWGAEHCIASVEGRGVYPFHSCVRGVHLVSEHVGNDSGRGEGVSHLCRLCGDLHCRSGLAEDNMAVLFDVP